MFKLNSVVAVVRSFGLGVLALAVLVGLTVSAQQQQPAQPVTVIKIVPEKPTPNDEIKLELSGTFQYTCIPTEAKVTVEFNQVTVSATNTEGSCLEAETKWNLSVPVGQKLAAGPYRVLVLFRMTKEPPDFLIGMARFDVAEKSGNADQAGRQAQPINAFTMLPVVQTLDGSTIVPSGALASNLNSSKSNLYNRVVTLPGTVGIVRGDVVELRKNLNSSKPNLRIVGCKAEDAQVVDNCIPPFRPDKPTKVLITGDNPIFTLLLEQTEPPDLAASLRLNVRRYTEREQVFCDVTGVATMSNVGQGPGGVVALRYSLNSTKSNVYRWGMDSGDNVTVPVTEIRLRPGMYLFEAEAQSRSIKEANLANNKATQVVTCR